MRQPLLLEFQCNALLGTETVKQRAFHQFDGLPAGADDTSIRPWAKTVFD